MSNKTLYRHEKERATIFQHPSSKRLYMSFYHKERRVQKTTGTDNLERAIAKLEATLENNKYFEEQGIQKSYIEAIKIKEIAREVIQDLERDKQPASSYRSYVKALKEIIKEIGNIDMENIDRVKIKPIFDKPMSKTMAENYRQALRRIYEKAEDKKIKFYKPTTPKAIYLETKKRQAITFKQFEALLAHYSAKFYYKINVRGRSQREIINAKKMYEFIVLAYATGARPGELDHIKGEDFELRQNDKGEVQYLLTIKNSKVDKHKEVKRKILVEVVIGRYFFEYYKQVKPKQYVFYNEASGKVISPYSLNRDDKRVNIKYYQKHKMEFFVPYCLRHAFITRKILKGVNLMILSQHVGSSIQMLNDFYADILNTISYDLLYEDQKAYIEDELALLEQSQKDRGIHIVNNYTHIKQSIEQTEGYIKEHFYDKENLFGANFLFDTDPLFKDKLNMMGSYYAEKEGLYYDENERRERERFEKESQEQIEYEQAIETKQEYDTDEVKDDLRTYGDEELDIPDFDDDSSIIF